MVARKNIFIIENDEEKKLELSIILRFINEDVTSYSSLTQFIASYEENIQSIRNNCLIFIRLKDEIRKQLLDFLKSSDSIAIVVIGENLLDKQLINHHHHFMMSMCEDQLQLNQLLNILHQVDIFYNTSRQKFQNNIKAKQNLFEGLEGVSHTIEKVRTLMMQVADTEANVLITGESGTGKEVVAKNLHFNSQRKDKPFIPVNCGAIPGELLESELFGHEKGAFTGAISSHLGRFELAKGGTLFLDEIGDMPLHMQVKLLRVLQEKTFERIGSTKTIHADVRIISATHNNLEKSISEGKFREDLYFRLNVFPIEMPALRERAEDIPHLINNLVSRLVVKSGISVRFNSSAIMTLCRYHWSGNIRELSNLIERLSITHPNQIIGVEDLPEKFNSMDVVKKENTAQVVEPQINFASLNQSTLLPVNGIDLKEYLGHLEINLIKQALGESNGIVARAAEKLRIRRTTLVEKMKKYDMANFRKEA